jgi:predicted CoA-substrate-specific enzyme activase
MISTGVDVGSLTAEAVAVGRAQGDSTTKSSLLASARISVLPDPVQSAQAVLDELDAKLVKGGWSRHDPGRTIATGYGRERLQEKGMAARQVSEISCHGFGAYSAQPSVRTVIDIGGQDAKAIRVNDDGDLENFSMNDKCAAGAGHFLELMSRTLEVKLEELGPLALSARKAVEMSSRCSIFIETEVIHYLQRGVDRADLAAGIAASMAERVSMLVRRVGVNAAVAMTGGVAKNLAVKREVEKRLGLRLLELNVDPQLIGAFGAAMLAQRDGESK